MNKSMLYKILGPLLFLSTLFLNPPEEMTESGFRLLGIILWMAVWWVSEVVPIAVTALLPIILFPFNECAKYSRNRVPTMVINIFSCLLVDLS